MNYGNRGYNQNNNFNPLVRYERNRESENTRENYINKYEENNNLNQQPGRLYLRNGAKPQHYKPSERNYDIISGRFKGYGKRVEDDYEELMKNQRYNMGEDNRPSENRQWNFQAENNNSGYRERNRILGNQYPQESRRGNNQYDEYNFKNEGRNNRDNLDIERSRRQQNFLAVGGENLWKVRSSTAELYTKDVDVRHAKESGIRNSGNSCYM